jgi:phospholipid transport system substrate-binding protein
VAALVLVVAAPALAGEPTDRLRTLFERANDVLLASDADGRGPDDRLVAVRALVADVFDFDGAASLAMGRHWDPMPPSARRAFTRLYADVVERGYLAWVAAKARIGEGGVSVRWLGEQIQGNAATVSSVLLARTGAELPIEYRLIRGKSGWLVRDVVVDGVSLAANYHVQVERVMQQGSYEELLARLQDKAGPAARAAAAAATETSAPLVAAELRERPDDLGSDVRRRVPFVPVVSAPLEPAVVAATPGAPPATASSPPTMASSPPATAPAASVTPDTASVTSSGSLVTPQTPTVTPRAVVASVTPATMRPPAASSRPVFWVQVGAFRTVDAATLVVQRLRQYAVTIAVAGDRRAPLTRVLLGPFAEQAAAASTVSALHARGIAAFIAGAPE